MKADLKIFHDNQEISEETLRENGFYEEVFNDIQQGLKNGNSWGECDHNINWALFVK